jgi:RNA polymerase sigma factor (sigma-70 family)
MNKDRAERITNLTKQHGRMVFATAYRILGNAEDAEDVLQDVFLKVLGKWRSPLNPDKVRDWGAYLRVTATRSAVDALKRKRKFRTTTNVEWIEQIEDPLGENPRRTAMRRQQADQLRKALRALPKRESRIFALRHFEEFSYEQIAQHLGSSVNSVGVILHRTHQRLRKLLQPEVSSSPQLAQINRHSPARVKENSHVAK